MLDQKMGAAKCYICLFIDNFKGHTISYQPCHIQMEYFEPNLTSFVQPLDAGVIQCFKAHYRQAFCRQAIDLDEAGERDIYKITIHEVMLMAKEAWGAVQPTTIQHCWDHCRIQPDGRGTDILPRNSHPTHKNSEAWAIIREFATNADTTLPIAECCLQDLLKDQYIYDDWKTALDAVMRAEGNIAQATEAVKQLTTAALR